VPVICTASMRAVVICGQYGLRAVPAADTCMHLSMPNLGAADETPV
jgi:hypothetical protein